MTAFRTIGLAGIAMLAASSAIPETNATDAGPNPFARPQAPRGGTEIGATASPTFVLRATMQSGRESLVNVDGEILRIGEEIGGYRLVAVGEGTAVFVKGAIPYVLSLDEER